MHSLNNSTPAIDQAISLAQQFREQLIYGGDDTKRAYFIEFMMLLGEKLNDLAQECGADNEYITSKDFEDLAASCFDVPCDGDDDRYNPLDPASMRKAHGTVHAHNGRVI